MSSHLSHMPHFFRLSNLIQKNVPSPSFYRMFSTAINSTSLYIVSNHPPAKVYAEGFPCEDLTVGGAPGWDLAAHFMYAGPSSIVPCYESAASITSTPISSDTYLYKIDPHGLPLTPDKITRFSPGLNRSMLMVGVYGGIRVSNIISYTHQGLTYHNPNYVSNKTPSIIQSDMATPSYETPIPTLK
jgi:hypothetical protein